MTIIYDPFNVFLMYLMYVMYLVYFLTIVYDPFNVFLNLFANTLLEFLHQCSSVILACNFYYFHCVLSDIGTRVRLAW